MKSEDKKNKLENLDAVNAELQRLFDDPEGFVSDPNITVSGSSGSTNPRISGSSEEGSSKEEPQKRRSLASHHRRHHHHHHSQHSSSAHDGSGEQESEGVTSNHRRTSHHRRFHRHRSRDDEPYVGNSGYKGQIGTVEIDREEFEKLHAMHEEQLDRKDIGDNIEVAKTEQDREGNSIAPVDSEYEEVQQADESVVKTTDATAEKETLKSVKEEEDIPSETQELDKTEEEVAVPRLAGTILAAREANPRATRKASSIKSAGSRQRKKKATVFSIVMRVLIGIAVVLLSCVCILLFMRVHGQASMTPKPEDVKIVIPKVEDPEAPEGVEKVEDDGKTVTYKGQKYRWNDKITTFLIMGTDRTVEQQDSGMTVAGANGQADSILLGVVDNKNKRISFISINRDTFVPVAEYTPNGEYVGDKKMQICLSYAYGKDDETSCRYTAEAVSKYLYGMPVNYYTRISYDAIPVLNDSVGGVTITIPEDLTAIDSAFEKGATLTLNGSQALRYVRWRNKKIVNTNEERISHQKQYLYAFMKQTMNATRSDFTLPLGLYSVIKPYMTTNVTASQITYMTSKTLEYGISGDSIRSIPGKSVVGAGNHIEFYPDETGLYEIVLDTFYNRVD